MSRNLENYAPAPVALVSGISACCNIPSIVDARVGRDGSIYLHVFETYEFSMDREHLDDVAYFCGALPEDVTVERTHEERDRATVVVANSYFDFGPQYNIYGMSGLEDSEEGVSDLVALALSRRS